MFKNKLTGQQIKKMVIGNTLIFLAVTIFSLIYKLIFGADNVLIAIATFIAMLMYLERDLTTNFFKNLLTFIFINLGTGIVVFISVHNFWLGIPLILIMFFIIGYITCNELRKPVYVPFILQFVFLYNFPVPTSKEWIRLLALLVGAILIMVPQLFFNRNRIQKNAAKIFIGLNGLMKQKLILISKNQDTKAIDTQIENLFRTLKTLIFGSREKSFFISNTGKAALNLLAGLEKLNNSISMNELKDFDFSFFSDHYFDNLSKLLSYKMKLNEFIELSNTFIDENINTLSKNKEGLKILNSLYIINDAVMNGKHHSITEIKDIPKNINFSLQFKKETKNVLGISYATRVAIGMTISWCVIHLMHSPIEEGVWMMFTIYSLVNPIYETAKYKTRDRMIATLLGAILTIILLSIFKTETSRMIVVLVFGYIMCYVKQYKYQIFFATICIIGMVAGTGNVFDYALTRVYMVILGLILAVILNTFVLKCDLKKLNTRLRRKFALAINEMFVTLGSIAKSKKLQDTIMDNFFLLAATIDKQLRDNYEVTLKEFKNELDPHSNILISDLYTLYLNLKLEINNEKYTTLVSDLMSRLSKSTETDEIEKEFNEILETNTPLNLKLAYSCILEIASYSHLLEDIYSKQNNMELAK
ncbi:MAG: FUSC family protein [Sarcina sp.]